MKDSYNVKLDIFEGPLDLLLHLIKKSEVDIYDIPIVDITNQYVEYMELAESMSLDLAGEFILMAATLIYIKSRMLLPIPETMVEEEDDGVDPRAELVRKLLEYQRFQEVAEELSKRPILGRDVFVRGLTPFNLSDFVEEDAMETGLDNVTLFDLISVFRDILDRAPTSHQVDVTVDRFRVADKVNHVMEVLDRDKSVIFRDLFPTGAPKGEIIVTFLAILELGKLLMVRINQTDDGVIRVYKPEERTTIPTSEEVH